MNPEIQDQPLQPPTRAEVMWPVYRSRELLEAYCAGQIDGRTFDRELKELTQHSERSLARMNLCLRAVQMSALDAKLKPKSRRKPAK